MTQVSIVSPAGGEPIRIGTTLMRILEDGSTTEHRLGIGEITLAPHTEGPPQHRHARHDEGFYVVSGRARFTVGENSYDAQAGTLVMVPPGAPHTFANPGDQPAVLLNTFTPDLYVGYFRDLRDMIARGQAVDGAAMIQTMRRYATEPVGTGSVGTDAPAGGTPRQYTVPVDGAGSVEVSVADYGAGQPYLLLHGGAGPQSVTGFAQLLSSAHPARVIVPTHPGFSGTGRPESLTSIRQLAELYTGLIEQLGLDNVTVIGNSIGGWIAVEIALLESTRVSGIVLVDAVGIEVPGHPVADFFHLSMDEVFDLGYHNPEPFRVDPATLPPAAQAVTAANRAALAVYAGEPMTDPGLAARLAAIEIPVLVLWGDSDRIVDPDYGRAYAKAIPTARFQLLPDTGHTPQIETPQQLLEAITGRRS